MRDCKNLSHFLRVPNSKREMRLMINFAQILHALQVCHSLCLPKGYQISLCQVQKSVYVPVFMLSQYPTPKKKSESYALQTRAPKCVPILDVPRILLRVQARDKLCLLPILAAIQPPSSLLNRRESSPFSGSRTGSFETPSSVQ